jgi:hypothetical protein
MVLDPRILKRIEAGIDAVDFTPAMVEDGFLRTKGAVLLQGRNQEQDGWRCEPQDIETRP